MKQETEQLLTVETGILAEGEIFWSATEGTSEPYGGTTFVITNLRTITLADDILVVMSVPHSSVALVRVYDKTDRWVVHVRIPVGGQVEEVYSNFPKDKYEISYLNKLVALMTTGIITGDPPITKSE